jgi:hypothetical protein
MRVYVSAAAFPDASDDLADSAPGIAFASGSAKWADQVKSRGQSGNLALDNLWGGSISINTKQKWSFNGRPGSYRYDFGSVMLHELFHVLGFGEWSKIKITAWKTYVNLANNTFIGPQAMAVYGNDEPAPVPLSGDLGHWANKLESLTTGGTKQVALMDAKGQLGQALQPTELDWAGLDDVGWNTDHLVVKTQPTSVVAGSPFDLTVLVEDPDGFVDPAFSGHVRVSLASPGQGGKLGGTVQATAVKGAVTFNGLTIDEPGMGIRLSIKAGGPVPAVTTGPIDVTPKPAFPLGTYRGNYTETVEIENNFGGPVSYVRSTGTIAVSILGYDRVDSLVSNGTVTITNFAGQVISTSIAGVVLAANASEVFNLGTEDNVTNASVSLGGTFQGTTMVVTLLSAEIDQGPDSDFTTNDHDSGFDFRLVWKGPSGFNRLRRSIRRRARHNRRVDRLSPGDRWCTRTARGRPRGPQVGRDYSRRRSNGRDLVASHAAAG